MLQNIQHGQVLCDDLVEDLLISLYNILPAPATIAFNPLNNPIAPLFDIIFVAADRSDNDTPLSLTLKA